MLIPAIAIVFFSQRVWICCFGSLKNLHRNFYGKIQIEWWLFLKCIAFTAPSITEKFGEVLQGYLIPLLRASSLAIVVTEINDLSLVLNVKNWIKMTEILWQMISVSVHQEHVFFINVFQLLIALIHVHIQFYISLQELQYHLA